MDVGSKFIEQRGVYMRPGGIGARAMEKHIFGVGVGEFNFLKERSNRSGTGLAIYRAAPCLTCDRYFRRRGQGWKRKAPDMKTTRTRR